MVRVIRFTGSLLSLGKASGCGRNDPKAIIAIRACDKHCGDRIL